MFNINNIKIYILELLLVVFLLFALFESNIISRTILSFVLLIYMFICYFLLRKRKTLPIYHKQITILMFIFAFIYLAVFYMLGLYFGYYEAPVKLSWWSLYKYIIPLIIIIVSSEIIRYILLSQKSNKHKSLVLLIMILIDMIIYTGIYKLSDLNDFLTVIGFILFASVACNLLYNYICLRFGYKGIIVYRLITVLYVYFIPIIPDVYIFFKSVLRMIAPYLIYLIIDYTYSKKSLVGDYVTERKRVLNTTVLLIFASFVAMLVSCQFRFGILVVGSGSMTGFLDKGDATLFEKYNNQIIHEGDVIIFNKDNTRIIHRVIDKKEINNEIRYYTKGDANQALDEGYITDKEILGITKLRIKYIGYPSIWIKDIFS